MDISKLSVDALRNIYTFLVTEGLMTEAQLLAIVTKYPSNDIKHTTDVVHSCSCTKDHDTECSYLSEEQRDVCWTLPAHQEWLDIVAGLLMRFSISETTLRVSFREAMAVAKEWDKLDAAAKYAFQKIIDAHSL